MQVWSKIAEGADTITQDLLFKWIDYQKSNARKIALKEKEHQQIQGSLRLTEISATFLQAHKYASTSNKEDIPFIIYVQVSFGSACSRPSNQNS